MNAKQLQYAVALSKALNYSQVAEQLNISQPALSKQIIALERELGVRLFERGVPLQLTPAGEHFIREAEDILFREDQLKRSMQDYKIGERGQLVIGISPFRSLYLIPSLVKKVRDRYPGIQVRLREISSDILRKEAAEGKYDFAIINLPVDESVLDVRPIEPDTLVLAVPTAMLDKVQHLPGGDLPEVDMSDCRNLPFIVVGPTQEMRQLFDKLCSAANLKPKIAMEVVGVTTAWAMCRAGIGATLLPYQFISDNEFDDRITLLKLKNASSFRQPAIVTRRGQHLSPYAQYAMDLLIGNK